MEQAVLERDITTDYQDEIKSLYRQLYLRTEYILSSDSLMDGYCDYLKRIDHVENDYLNAKTEISSELSQFDVTEQEILDFLASL